MKFWFKGENDMMQCVTCNKSSLFVPKLKSIEKTKKRWISLQGKKHPQGKGRHAVQESCHPGFSHYNILSSSSTKLNHGPLPTWSPRPHDASIGCCSCFFMFPSSQGCCDSTFWTRFGFCHILQATEIGTWWQLCVSGDYCGNSFFSLQ
jgi:hypothetical protein